MRRWCVPSSVITAASITVALESIDAHPLPVQQHPDVGAIIGDQLHAHVGDSRVRAARGTSKNTTDHTLAQELLDRDGEGARATMPPEYAHTLTRCIGQSETLQIDQSRIQLAPGDRVLFCTDGLNKVVPPAKVAAILQSSDDPEQLCSALIETANASEGPDNITAIIILIDS